MSQIDIQYSEFHHQYLKKHLRAYTIACACTLNMNRKQIPKLIYQYSVNVEELQYFSLVEYIIKYGEIRADRTGVGTKSVFGISHRYSLRDNKIPLLTTKSVHFPSVAKELLWFISGSTSEADLRKVGVTIWKKNAEDFHKRQLVIGNINHNPSDMRAIYSHSWRHYGAEYIDCTTDYSGLGVDQLANVIHLIKTDPTSRRILLNAWDPRHVNADDVALPPCHVLYNFMVGNASAPCSERKLSCILFLRSQDVCLGAPFNISSAALLTHMIAHLCGMKAGELIYNTGDTHLYLNHLEPIKQQLYRNPTAFPTLEILRSAEEINSVDGFKFEDFKIHDYNPMSKIHFDMAV
jgi:thymidylate synthase